MEDVMDAKAALKAKLAARQEDQALQAAQPSAAQPSAHKAPKASTPPHAEPSEAESSGNELRKKLEQRKSSSAPSRNKGGGPDQPRAGAYAKLEGPAFRYLVQTVCVTLGRDRERPRKRLAIGEGIHEESSANGTSGSSKTGSESFVSLGPSTRISRKHLQIVWNFRKKEWYLLCFGNSGVEVDGTHVPQGGRPMLLKNQCKISVPDANIFFFLCPHSDRNPAKKMKSNVSSKINGPPQNQSMFEMERPTQTFNSLIAEAIALSPEKRLAVSDIYQYVRDKYPYYRMNPDPSWQSSIRHTLTSNKSFIKTDRDSMDHANKSALWTMKEEALEAVTIEEPPESTQQIPRPSPGIGEELQRDSTSPFVPSEAEADNGDGESEDILISSETIQDGNSTLDSNLGQDGARFEDSEEEEDLVIDEEDHLDDD